MAKQASTATGVVDVRQLDLLGTADDKPTSDRLGEPATRTVRRRPTLAERPRNGRRRAWGSVQRAVKTALAADPDREWSGKDLAEHLDGGITENHANVVLAKLAQRGELQRSAPARFRVVALEPVGTGTIAGSRPSAEWQSVAVLNDRERLLRSSDGTLWVARPARVS